MADHAPDFQHDQRRQPFGRFVQDQQGRAAEQGAALLQQEAVHLRAAVREAAGSPGARCVAAAGGVVFVNSLRLAAIATYPDRFDTLHAGWLGAAFGWAALFVAGGIVILGTARAART